MSRNLDLTSLRSFVAVADTGGVTRAAALMHLTQSAVSMQIKRLEDMLGLTLLERAARSVRLTQAGEQLLSHARRLLAANDEIFSRLTAQQFEGEVRLGVPNDVVHPVIPKVLRQLAIDYPRVKVQLVSSFTHPLKAQFARGELDATLTTEDDADESGETLTTIPLIWVGAQGGQAWKQRPLRLAYEDFCIFRQGVQRRLDAAGIPWEMAVQTNSSRTVEATVSADLAVHTMLEGTEPRQFERIAHGGALPELRQVAVNLYVHDRGDGPVVHDMARMIREGYRELSLRA